MGKRIEPGDPALGRLFTGFAHTAFRLETLQSYDVGYENDAYARFLAGLPAVPDPGVDEWLDIVSDAIAAGKVMQRVHLVDEPLSTYLRFEFSFYERSTAAGEDVRILPVRAWSGVYLGWDYWLFDSRDLWVMEYDGDGRFLGATQVTDPAAIVQHGYRRDGTLHAATRFRDYAARVPELRRAS